MDTFNKNLDPKLDADFNARVVSIVKNYLESGAFTERKLTDTPTDTNQVVPRGYVTLNGASSERPLSSVIGQRYFDTTLASGRGKPIWWNGTGFVDGDGTYV